MVHIGAICTNIEYIATVKHASFVPFLPHTASKKHLTDRQSPRCISMPAELIAIEQKSLQPLTPHH